MFSFGTLKGHRCHAAELLYIVTDEKSISVNGENLIRSFFQGSSDSIYFIPVIILLVSTDFECKLDLLGKFNGKCFKISNINKLRTCIMF